MASEIPISDRFEPVPWWVSHLAVLGLGIAATSATALPSAKDASFARGKAESDKYWQKVVSDLEGMHHARMVELQSRVDTLEATADGR